MKKNYFQLFLAALVSFSFFFQSPDTATVLAQSSPSANNPYFEQLPAGYVIPEKLPKSISDPLLIAGWVYLYNQEQAIQNWDGSTLTGRQLAQYVIDTRLTVQWNTTSECGGRSCAPRSLSGKKNNYPVLISLSYQDLTQSDLAELAGSLAHEIFHHQLPFGGVKDTLYEEYWAYSTEAHISNNPLFDFEGYNPQQAACLKLWFGVHQLKYYSKLAYFPAVVEAQADMNDKNCSLIRKLPGEVSNP